MNARSFFIWTLLALALSALFFAPFVRAQDDVEVADDDEISALEADMEDYEEADAESLEDFVMYEPSPDVTAAFVFPDSAAGKFPMGEPISVLVNLHNKGQRTFQISSLGAFFQSPFDLSYYIQNFSRFDVESVLLPGHEASLEYRFMPDKALEPIDYHLTAFVEYNSTDGRAFRTVFANQTVELLDTSSAFSPSSILSYLLIAGALAGTGYLVLGSESGSSLAKKIAPKQKSKPAEAGPKKDPVVHQEEWAGPVYKPSQRSVAVGKKKSNKKASSKKSSD